MDYTPLQETFDKTAIQEVRARFAEGQDYQNWAQVTTLLTESVDVDFSSMGIPAQRVPREALVENFRHNLS